MKKFIFVHIQKTAGTSVLNTLRGSYTPEEIFHDKSFRYGRYRGLFKNVIKCDRMVPSFDKDKIKIIFGHFTIKKYWALNWPFISFLRHPVDRIVSGYSSWNRHTKNTEKSIADYAKLCPNAMTKMIGGDLDNFIFIGICERYKESISKLGKILGTDLSGSIKSNVTKRKFSKYIPTLKEIIEIKAYNKMDIELYFDAWNRL